MGETGTIPRGTVSRSIALIVNPHARSHRRRPGLVDRMRAVAEGAGVSLHSTESVEALRRVATELARDEVPLVLLSGGDGTLMEGVSALAGAYGDHHLPVVAPLPAGTAGTVARNWGVAGDPLRALQRLLSRPRRILHQATLDVRWTAEGEHRRLGFIVGTGLVANFFRLYYERGAPGYAGSAAIVARVFAESFVGGPTAERILTPLPCELTVDGERQGPEAWSLVCAAVVKNLGLHLLVTYRGGDDPQRPHLVATPMLPRALGPRAPLVFAGASLGGPDGVDRLTRTFSIEFPTEEGPFVLDGELLRGRRVVVQAGPALRVAVAT